MIRVTIIESPYAAPTPEGIARNRRYLDACILDCIRRGETPYASHKMLTDALNDANPEEREQGIQAGFAMREVLAESGWNGAPFPTTVVYGDLGESGGMKRGIVHTIELGLPIEHRTLGGEWAAPAYPHRGCQLCCGRMFVKTGVAGEYTSCSGCSK